MKLYRIFWDWSLDSCNNGRSGESYRTAFGCGLTLKQILRELDEINMKMCLAQGCDWRLVEA